jgi:hypothetical protein
MADRIWRAELSLALDRFSKNRLASQMEQGLEGKKKFT